jgi:hypothetical protein
VLVSVSAECVSMVASRAADYAHHAAT